MTQREAGPRLLLCAGQGCEDRRTCLRFRSRATHSDWASFDIERRKLKGPCPAFIVVVQVSNRKH